MADIFGSRISGVVIIQWTAWSRYAEEVIRVFDGTNRFVLQFGQLQRSYTNTQWLLSLT